jgi:hypothetical protein
MMAAWSLPRDEPPGWHVMSCRKRNAFGIDRDQIATSRGAPRRLAFLASSTHCEIRQPGVTFENQAPQMTRDWTPRYRNPVARALSVASGGDWWHFLFH